MTQEEKILFAEIKQAAREYIKDYYDAYFEDGNDYDIYSAETLWQCCGQWAHNEGAEEAVVERVPMAADYEDRLWDFDDLYYKLYDAITAGFELGNYEYYEDNKDFFHNAA